MRLLGYFIPATEKNLRNPVKNNNAQVHQTMIQISPFILSVYTSETCEISVFKKKKKVKPLFIKTCHSELTPLALLGYILEMQNFKSGMVVHAFIPNT